MNKQPIKFSIPVLKPRMHYALFAEDSPFKPKKVKCKTLYQRKPKFVNREDNWQ